MYALAKESWVLRVILRKFIIFNCFAQEALQKTQLLLCNTSYALSYYAHSVQFQISYKRIKIHSVTMGHL